HPHIRTPHLDKLAAQSLVFPRGYVPTALCSPSLTTLLTGRYPHEHLITYNDPPAPPGGKTGNWRNHPQYVAAWDEMRSFIRDQPTLPRLLQQQGYVSLQTGKWWLGNYQNGGFTDGMSHGDRKRGGRHGDEGLDIGRKTMQPVFDFIQRARRDNKPFFVWYAPMLPHDPHDAPQRLVDKYKDKAPNLQTAKYWANVEWFDESCGQLLDYLEREKLSDNTIVVYVTDNGWVQGPERDNHSVRSKRTPYDAGVRTPIMLRWPGKVKAAKSSQLASSLDLFPTVLTAVGAQVPAGAAGLNLLNARAVAARRTLYGECFTHDAIDLRKPSANLYSRWILDGEWKLIVPVASRPHDEGPKEIELYRITTDVAETTNLAAQEPARVQALQRKLDVWWRP
ncbi:MAG TPA: sulfatase-like hydrolase/transferase, partial [Blastocatellia bacterium]|nr:sulfatase-like hydrolase/transferase [Blastocatellia bacterium]